MTLLLVIRHAPTDWNEVRLIQGRTDRPLSAAGRNLAAGWRLPPGWDVAHCLCSPLTRAMQTARLLGLDPHPEPRLIEMDWGAWEGRTLPEVRAEFGEDMIRNEAEGLDFRPPGGESPRDVQERLKPLLASLSARSVAVTHKGVLRALYALATGWTMHDKAPERLIEGCAHAFRIGPAGALAIERLNIPLQGSA